MNDASRDRQVLENKFQQPKAIVNLITTGLSVVGVLALFLPTSLAKSLSIATLLTASSTLGLSRLTHKTYVDIAFEQARKEDIRRSEDLKNRTAENAELSRSLSRLNEQVAVAVQTETERKNVNERLQSQVKLVSSEKEHAESYLASLTKRFGELQQFSNLNRSSVIKTLLDSLAWWEDKLGGNLADFKRTYPELEGRLDKIAGELGKKIPDFRDRINELSGETDVTELLSHAFSIEHWMGEEFSSVRVRMIKALDTRKLQNVTVDNQSLAEENEHLRSLDVVPRDSLEVVIGNYESRLKEFQTEYHGHIQQTMQFASELENLVLNEDPVFLKLRMLSQQLAEQVETLKSELVDAKKLRLFDQVGWKSSAANEVLMHFAIQGITCDACPLPIRDVGHEIEFYITPRTRIGMSLVQADVDKVAESLKIPLGIKSVRVTVEGHNLKIRIPVKDRELEKSPPEDALIRSVDLWSLYIASEYHLVIFAATQSGKTILADELDAMMHLRLNGDIEFSAITLKNDGNRDEEKISRFVKPVFMSSNDEYRQAISEIHEAIESRNQILQVNPDKHLPRSIHQWDEYGEYYRLGSEEDKKAGKLALITILQRGAGLSSETGKGIGLVLIAQNPYVGQLGISRPDLANTCIVVVGEKNIRLFLGSDEQNHGLDEDDLERVREELKTFKAASRKASDKAAEEALARGEDSAIAIRRCPENYYSLIIPSKAGLKPIIIYNPAPGEFTNGLVKPSQGESISALPTCPDCGTPSLKKRGKEGNRYLCENSGCERQTFTQRG